ncbi:MAG: methyl-accepting chemotaxis protein [Myxococcota bacterium]|jgi:methyl-accepting chemotaxis protein|nr:methyl-accepting chemotaxis protein [Myxococcota bacterium]
MTERSHSDVRNLPGQVSRLVWMACGVWSFALAISCALLLREVDSGGWWAVAPVVGCGLIACTVLSMSMRQRLQPIVRECENDQGKKEQHATPPVKEVAETRRVEAFRAAVALPMLAQRWFLAGGAVLSLAIAIATPAMLTGRLGPLAVVASLALCGVALSAAVAVAFYYAVKRTLAPALGELTLALCDPAVRAKAIEPVPLQRKGAYAMLACASLAVVVAVTLSLSHGRMAFRGLVDDTQERVLDAVARAHEEVTFEVAVERVLGDSSAHMIPVSITLFSPDDAEASDLLPELAQRITGWLEAGVSSGHFDAAGGAVRVGVRELPDGEIAVAQVSRESLEAQWPSPLLPIAWIALLSGGCAWWLARQFSADVCEAVMSLSQASEHMSQGNLIRERVWESDDELGEMWRSFEVMGNAFRTTVRNLADAADRVDAAAAEIEAVSDGVAGASADQVQRIQQASELMVSINSEVMEVAGSAQELNIAIEESSSSILELGAAGEELNQTASVLGSKVDEVSGSIEQMVRSVKQVSSNSDGLADAAAETSASMEEMAGAMRAVDTTAELTADLSRNVVGSAESGQQKVSQTIDGMQAIRDATDTAENVIRGLGARTQEIGAILDVIDAVAEETNLLALNAAIIAAQAGEHGRAFSVVADEIKELADRVLASTKEIGGLIKSVQDESNNAVGAIEVGSRSVASGVELSAEAGLSLEEITSSSRESGQRIGEIVSAVREQTKAASHVVALMDTVRDGVTAIVSAAADQDRGNEVVYRSSVTMRDVAQQVRRTTEEQSRGFVRIRESIEGVREVVENINHSLHGQSTACSQVTQFLEQVFERTRSNEEAAGSMNESVRGLVAQAEALRENVTRFQV